MGLQSVYTGHSDGGTEHHQPPGAPHPSPEIMELLCYVISTVYFWTCAFQSAIHLDWFYVWCEEGVKIYKQKP